MNGDEGAAEEFLRFQSSDTFVDFLLRVVTDADSVAQVAGNLAQVSGRLAKRPELELERNFLAGATEQLREEAGAGMRRQEAAQGRLGPLVGARARHWGLSSRAAAGGGARGA